jgi:hypothetical protein
MSARARIVWGVSLIACLVGPFATTPGHAATKKKTTTTIVSTTQVGGGDSGEPVKQAAVVVVDPFKAGKHVKIKYFEQAADESWTLLDSANPALDNYGTAYADDFEVSESDGLCKLTAKYEGTSKQKTSKDSVKILCATGQPQV